MKKLLIYLAADWLQMIGGMTVGLSIPVGMCLLENKLLGFAIAFPLGVLMIGTSYYFKFIYKSR